MVAPARGCIDPTIERRRLMKLLTALIAGALLTVLTGCNTIEGAGKDVRATGAAVERAADDAKPK
jgi:predicted small secreted protein